ncbi:MAG: cobalamin-independent methionine synthase II family protein [Alphaproteobacteria bacterium]
MKLDQTFGDPAFRALPPLPTMGVGSYAAPGWFGLARRAMRDGAMGPIDADELLNDATRVVVDDQLEAGVDILSDGELRRQRFVYEAYDRLHGLARQPPARKLGITGYDMAPHFLATGPITAPNGIGTVEEFLILRGMAPNRPLKIALPGPLTFAGFIQPGERGQQAVLDDCIALVKAEIAALVDAGARYIQLDEPGLATAGKGWTPAQGVAAINKAIGGANATMAVHVCFGNNAGRPMADRRLEPLLDAVEQLAVPHLVLEFANREMSGVEHLRRLSAKFVVACGVVDVKNFYVETRDDVARRIDQCLAHLPADAMIVTADCGFSALPRYVARQKMQAMVDGARLVRGRN